MSNFAEIIAACESASGAGTKKEIMSALSRADPVAQRLIKEALDPYRVFGVRKYDPPAAHGRQGGYIELFSLLDSLASRELTGNAARDEVTRVLALFPAEEARYISRVFDKDLKAGFSADTVNKLFPGLVPTFEVMLADKCETPDDFETAITFPCQGDFKYDGCLSKSWTIELEDGKIITIGEFVDNNMDGKVLSFNPTTKKKEWKKILARVKNSMPERSYEWFRITLEDGTVLPPLTGNHRVWLPLLKCWRRVDELIESDVLLSNKYHHTSNGGKDGIMDNTIKE